MWRPVRGALCCFAIALVGCSSTDRFFLVDATLRRARVHQEFKQSIRTAADDALVLSGHEIVPGSDIVIAVRTFKRGISLLPDQAAYEKLTVVLPAVDVGEEARVEFRGESQAIAFVSWGNSASPKITGCMGYPKAGSLVYELASPDRLRVEMDLDMTTVSPAQWAGECGQRRWRFSGEFRRKAIDQLSAWEGKPVENTWLAAQP